MGAFSELISIIIINIVLMFRRRYDVVAGNNGKKGWEGLPPQRQGGTFRD